MSSGTQLPLRVRLDFVQSYTRSGIQGTLQPLLDDIPDPCMGSLVGVQASLFKCVSAALSGRLERHLIQTTCSNVQLLVRYAHPRRCSGFSDSVLYFDMAW